MGEQKLNLTPSLHDEFSDDQSLEELIREVMQLGELSIDTALAYSIMEGKCIEIIADNSVDDIGAKAGITFEKDCTTVGVTIRRRRGTTRSMKIFK